MNTGPSPVVASAALNRTVGSYYDSTLDLYEQLWGEHVHHGYWAPGQSPGSGHDRHAASERTVRELATFAGIEPGSAVLDAGCGIGGPATYLAREYGCRVDGVTLSAQQVARARQRADEAGLADRVRYRQADVLDTGYPDGTFDAVWALELLEHVPDRGRFFAEAMRLLRPGGTLAVGTWCIRPGDLTAADQRLLAQIYRHQAIPSLRPLDEYERLCRGAGLGDVRVADWSDAVRRTWDTGFTDVEQLGDRKSFLVDLARAKGVEALGFFYAIPLMKRGYDSGLMRYGVIRATSLPVTRAD